VFPKGIEAVIHRGRAARAILGLCVLMCAFPSEVWAGTTGKIAGRVLDTKKQPLAGVNIAIPALRLGAATDAEGRFTILQVPPGSWELHVSLLSYRPVTLQGVQVSADNTASVDVELTEAPIKMDELVVSAKRPVVDTKLTSRLASVHAEEIAKLPVQDLQEIVNLQAGVVDGHFSGGRLGEVQYQVDGVSVNNPYDNSNGLQIDRSLIQEVQVVSGTFDAEYGQAMSGVVNTVLKRGSDRFTWNLEVYGGMYVYSDSARGLTYNPRPASLANFQASASGPLPFSKTNYLLSARHYSADGATFGQRVYTPWARVPPQDKVANPDGDSTAAAMSWSDEWSGLGKITNRSIPNLELGYQAVVDWNYLQNSSYAFHLDPDGIAPTHMRSLVHGLDATHTISKTTYLGVTLRQNYFDTRTMKYDDLYDPRYDLAGPPTQNPTDPTSGAYIQGVDFTRFTQTTNALVLKSTFTSQIRRDQQLKMGLEYQWPIVQFGSPGTLTYSQQNGVNTLVRHVDEPPNFPGVQEYRPYITNAYAQDELEWNDLRVRAGLRLEYFNPRATVPSDPANPANSIVGVPESTPQQATRKITLAPRIGVSYPVTPRAAVYFAYGHFYQMPDLGQIYGNADYNVLSGLQAGGVSYSVLGNPDVKPERTVQYEFGYKQSVTDDFGLEASMFFKDIRDLLGVEFIDTYNGATYTRLTNVDFGSVSGITLTVNRRSRWVTTELNYTWQMAQGNSSDPTETATRAAAGEDPRPRTVPFNWDQRHTLNLSVAIDKPGVYSASTILRLASGQPYTPATTVGFGSGLETNSGRKPSSAIVDLRGEKYFGNASTPATFFVRVFNLFDQRFNNGFVFDTSGSPYYSRFPAKDAATLADPTRYYAPRRIEVGITLAAGTSN
jgi:outer membrane receptor protein involved in Fe transport